MSQSIAKAVKCRYIKSTNSIKSSNFEMDLTTTRAWSYSWWMFCIKVNDLVIFNHTTYSPSTCKHQSKALKVLDYTYDLRLRYTRKSLTNLADALDDEIQGAKSVINSLIETIRKPRTRASTNTERRKQVTELVKHIGLVRKVKQLTKAV